MYRVDTRLFEVNQIIEFSGDSYQNRLPEQKRIIETILNEQRTNGNNTNRATALYTFVQLADAIRFCYKYTNSKIYKVQPVVNNSTIFHSGDMSWTEIMARFTTNEDLLRFFAKQYWENQVLYKPCWEILLDRVTVTGILIGDERQRIQLKHDFSSVSANAERLNFYLEHLGI